MPNDPETAGVVADAAAAAAVAEALGVVVVVEKEEVCDEVEEMVFASGGEIAAEVDKLSLEMLKALASFFGKGTARLPR